MTIGKPIAKRTAEGTVLSAAVSFQGITDECFYSVPAEFAGLADTESSNCFLVGMLYPAMRYGEDIRVEGRVSAKLLYNLNEYLVPMMAIVDPRLKRIHIEAGSADGNFHPGAKAVGTGFSGGVDSFATIYEHLERPSPEGFRLTHLFFFNVGAHGIPKKPGDMESIGRQFRARFEKLKAFRSIRTSTSSIRGDISKSRRSPRFRRCCSSSAGYAATISRRRATPTGSCGSFSATAGVRTR